MLTKALSGLKITDADQGRVQAVFATFNVKDLDDDVTLPGAFQTGAPVRISAFNHTSWGGALPVGKGTISETDAGAVLDGQFFMNTQAGRDTFETVKQMGELQEWSYGYDILESSEGQLDGETVTFLKSLVVYEVSPVLLGAGIETRTLALKASGPACVECSKQTAPLFDACGLLKAAICQGCGHIDRTAGKQLDSDLENRLCDAGAERFGTADTYCYLFDHDLDANFAVYAVCSQDGDQQLVQVSFNREDDGGVTLLPGGTDVEVETTIVPAKARTAAKTAKADNEPDAVKQAIAPHTTKTSDDPWDGPAEVKKLDTPITAQTAQGMFAWYDEHAADGNGDGWPDAKSAYKFPHHFGAGGPASTRACSGIIAALNGGRGGTSIPDSDRKGVYNHAAKHLRDAGVDDVPDLKEHSGGELKLSDDLATADLAVGEALVRFADVVTMRAQTGKQVAADTRQEAALLADRLKSAERTLREVVTSAETTQPTDVTADGGERRLTLDDETALAETLGRYGLAL